MSETREGGCLCGAVRYVVPEKPIMTAVCHCRNCQKQSGTAMSVVAVYPRDAVAVSGELTVFEDQGESGRTVFRQFCGKCGSPILSDTSRAAEAGIIFLKAGTLDSPDDLQPRAHYWTQSKLPWMPIPVGCEVFDRE